MGPTRSNRIENSKRPKSGCPRVTSAPSDWSAGSAVLRSISLFAGSIDESPSLGPEKLHARERGGSVVFSSLHEVSVSSRNCSQLSRVRRRVGTGDGRMDPRARLRITGAVHRRGRVRGWRGLARVAVPTRGASEPFVPSGADQTVPLDDAFFAGQTVVVGSVRVRSARGVRVHTVHAAHERLWQGVRGVRRLLHRAIVPVG